MDGDYDIVQNALRAERARPAYKLGIRYEQPGYYYLAFVLRNTPARENFTVLPSGYFFRKKVTHPCSPVCSPHCFLCVICCMHDWLTLLP